MATITLKIGNQPTKLQFGISTIALLTTNIVVIVLAVAQQWSTGEVLWVYWGQSVMIGAMNILQIATLQHRKAEGQETEVTTLTKVYSALFFLFHFGLFLLVYAYVLQKYYQFPWTTGVMVGLVLFAVNHLFSFWKHQQQAQRQQPTLRTLMSFPYMRIIPMHLLIALNALGHGQTTLVLFMVLKTAVDVLLHGLHRGNKTRSLEQSGVV